MFSIKNILALALAITFTFVACDDDDDSEVPQAGEEVECVASEEEPCEEQEEEELAGMELPEELEAGSVESEELDMELPVESGEESTEEESTEEESSEEESSEG